MFMSKWFSWLCAGGCACALLPPLQKMAAADVVGLLNGSSEQSTFNVGTTQNDLSAIGWLEFSGDSRAWQDPAYGGGVNGILIHQTSTTGLFEARYDTNVALRPNTTYYLIVDVGFGGTAAGGSGTSTVQLGTFSGGVFSSSTAATRTAKRNGGAYDNVFSDRSCLTFTTGGSVAPGSTLGISLARTSGTNTAYWLGFDNAVLWALPSNFSYVGNLDGTSLQSTFYDSALGGNVDDTNLPGGWLEFQGNTRVFGNLAAAGPGYGVISADANKANFSILYDTQTPIQANTEYLLTTEIGFATLTGSSPIAGNFRLEIGTWDGANFTSLAANSGAVSFISSGFESGASGITALNLTTGTLVSGQNVAVRLSRIDGGTANWQGFDNVILRAAPVPEPNAFIMFVSMLLGLLAYAWRRKK